MKTDAERLAELESMVINLTWYYTVFSTYWKKNKNFKEARENHQIFGHTLWEALLCSFIVTAEAVFHEGSNDESLFNFIRHIEKKTKKSAISPALKSQRQSMKPTFQKLYVLRNHVFAHRFQDTNAQSVFNNAGLNLRMMKNLSTFAKKILFQLVGKERSKFLRNQMFSEYTIKRLKNDTRLVLKTFRDNA